MTLDDINTIIAKGGAAALSTEMEKHICTAIESFALIHIDAEPKDLYAAISATRHSLSLVLWLLEVW